MQTLEKPNGVEEESRKSSTCQPGSSIKYSDMLLVKPLPSFIDKSSPLLDTVVAPEEEFLATEGGFGIAGETETDFLAET